MDQINALAGFYEKNKNKEIVVVQGLGFVGAVMSLVIANSTKKDYAVIGVDLPIEDGIRKTESLNNGHFPVNSSDPKVGEYFKKTIHKGNFLAVTNPYAYSIADVIIVDINLDVIKIRNNGDAFCNYEVDLSLFKEAVRTIASTCKADVLVIIETTVPPGTTEQIVKPIFIEEFKKRGLINSFCLAHSYERVMPGDKYIDSIENFFRVFAGIDEKSSERARDFLTSIINTSRYPLTELSSTTASEIGKVLENSYRAMNIAFMQEWTVFAENAGVNLYEVIEAIKLRDTHKNIMYPGLGVGGYCLTKDPLLASWSSKNLFGGSKLPNCEESVRINDAMPIHSFEQISKYFNDDIAGKQFLFLGVSYLSNIGDTRSTPVELFFDSIINSGGIVTLHDPFMDKWFEKNMRVLTGLPEALARRYDCIALTTAHTLYRESFDIIEYINNNDVFLIDTNHVLTNKQIEQIVNKKKLCIIGRGDI